MLIFGTRRYLYTLGMLTFLCPQCQNPSAHALRRAVTKFTLFFIPLFPVSSSRSLQCTFCGFQTAVTQDQAEEMLAGQAAPAPGSPLAAQTHPSRTDRH